MVNMSPSFNVCSAVLIAPMSFDPRDTGNASAIFKMGLSILWSNSSFFAITRMWRGTDAISTGGSHRLVWFTARITGPSLGRFSFPISFTKKTTWQKICTKNFKKDNNNKTSFQLIL